MTLLEFITYCQLKGYVEEQHPVTVSRDIHIHTITLGRGNIGVAITYADEGIDFNRIDFNTTINLCDYATGLPWQESHLEEVIALIAPELL